MFFCYLEVHDVFSHFQGGIKFFLLEEKACVRVKVTGNETLKQAVIFRVGDKGYIIERLIYTGEV